MKNILFSLSLSRQSFYDPKRNKFILMLSIAHKSICIKPFSIFRVKCSEQNFPIVWASVIKMTKVSSLNFLTLRQ